MGGWRCHPQQSCRPPVAKPGRTREKQAALLMAPASSRNAVSFGYFMLNLLFRPAAACSRAHPASSVSLVDLGLRLALGGDQGPAQLTTHILARGR